VTDVLCAKERRFFREIASPE